MDDKDGTILIVDDDQNTREGLMTLLGDDHNCIAAGTAEEAVRLLAARPFDLLLTDIHMPGASGLELCRLAHRLCPGTVVIVISGMSDIRYQIEAMRQGTLYYIEKPVDLEKLTTLVESALNSQALGAARHRRKPAKTNANNSLGAKAS
jgi:two-component system, NtrC family, response regulator AtoC